ncbi:MAG: PD40 domain-containing protein [Ardenticatenaceae bacterium]|nr:PD40 domain-containing protein [Ardenticatenaceae bacterium]
MMDKYTGLENTRLTCFLFPLMITLALANIGCTIDKEIVVVTRPTIVATTAVSTPIPPSPSQESSPPTPSGLSLPNPMSLLPGMLYWGSDGTGTWLVDANSQQNKLSELVIVPKFWVDANKFIYLDNKDLWEIDKNSSEQTHIFSFSSFDSWYYWSAKTGVVWFLDTTNLDNEELHIGKLKMVDRLGNVLDLSDGYLSHVPAITPDEKGIAFDEDRSPTIYRLESGIQRFNLIDYGLAPELDFYKPVWSPNGQLIAWGVHDPTKDVYSLVILDAAAKTAQSLLLDENPHRYINEIYWNPTSDKLLALRAKNESDITLYDSWMIDLKTEEITFTGPIIEAAWSPNGEWLAYINEETVGEPYDSVWVMQVAEHEQYHLGYGEGLVWSPDGRYVTFCNLEAWEEENSAANWIATAENDWLPVPMDFGYQEGCVNLQWLNLEQPDIVNYILPQLPASTTLITTPILPTATANGPTTCNLYRSGGLTPPPMLPPVCNEVLPVYEEQGYCSCGIFQVSPDGKWFAFSMGDDYITGNIAQLGLINLQTGEVQQNIGGTGIMRFLPNDERLVYNSWGEGGEIWWGDSSTGETMRLGSDGRVVWNANETAFAVEVSPYVGMAGAVWGYNLASHNLFLPQNWAADSQPTWTPDGTHLLYQHQAITVTQEYSTTLGPKEVRLVDAVSGATQTILSDPGYHYQICASGCLWAEDWLQVRRFQYTPTTVQFEDYSNLGYRCSWYGEDCGGIPEWLALNWRTGQILPWEEVAPLSPSSLKP